LPTRSRLNMFTTVPLGGESNRSPTTVRRGRRSIRAPTVPWPPSSSFAHVKAPRQAGLSATRNRWAGIAQPKIFPPSPACPTDAVGRSQRRLSFYPLPRRSDSRGFSSAAETVARAPLDGRSAIRCPVPESVEPLPQPFQSRPQAPFGNPHPSLRFEGNMQGRPSGFSKRARKSGQ